MDPVPPTAASNSLNLTLVAGQLIGGLALFHANGFQGPPLECNA